MADRYVREIGYVVDMYGCFVHVGVDYGAVTMRTFSAVTLSKPQREHLDRLLYQADTEAAANIAALKELDEDDLAAAAEEALMSP